MLVSLAALALSQVGASSEMRLMRFPAVHGNTVVFTYAGDLWSAELTGGLARRLTTHPGSEQYSSFSPDGKWIAFTGTYDGNPDVFVMPTEGGEPKRLTFEPGAEIVRGWTPDGKIAYITSHDTPGSFTAGLRLISPEGGFPSATKLNEVADVSFAADGKRVAFNRNNSHNFNWRRYRGGTQGRIAFSDLDASTYREIPSGRENRWHPMWVGNKVFYIGDKNQGTRNLYAFDTTNNRETQLTNYADSDIKWPSTDGKTIVFEKNGELYRFNVADNKVDKIVPKLAGDLVAARPQLRKLGSMVNDFSLSPSGARIAVAARGELFSVPARTGETRHFGGDSSSKESNIAWSPDGKVIAFMSDKSGEARIYTMPQMGGDWTEVATPVEHRLTGFQWAPNSQKLSYTTVTNDLYVFDMASKRAEKVVTDEFGAITVHNWSPDSNWITVITSGKNLQSAVNLYSLEKKELTQITEGYYRDDFATFDQNGKYLYIISARTFNPTPGAFEFNLNFSAAQRVYVIPLAADTPNPLLRPGDEEPAGEAPKQPEKPGPMRVDLAGMGNRAVALPWPSGDYGALIGINNGVIALTPQGTMLMFDFNSRQPMTLLQGVQALDVNPSRSKMAYIAGGVLGIVDLRPGVEAGQGRVNLNDVEAVIDPRKEWKQIFWEAWRWQRDKFYDKDMLGLNWMAIGRQYEKFLPFVAHRSDLSYVMGLMIGELGTGHAYVGGGDMGTPVTAIPTGTLGADYELANGRVRFKKIYRGLAFEEPRRGPLGDPAVVVKEGEYLLAIDGNAVGSQNPHALLVGKVNRLVTLTVNDKPTMDGARKVVVRTTASETELRYIEWVEGNRRKVAELSGGRIGYLHVPDTSVDGMIEFTKGYYSQSDKEALIVDERFNGGGMIPTFFIEKLIREAKAAFRQRNGGDVSFPPQSVEGPKAMLVNEYAGSGGDLFPWFFRQAKLGPLIGTRTWGGLVGITGSAPLVDGGMLTAPEFGLYDPVEGKWIAENTGVDPDINIDNRPDQLAAGKDPQLEKAVEHLLNELKKGKRPVKRPEFPRVKVSGGG
jgi:tricorn protease